MQSGIRTTEFNLGICILSLANHVKLKIIIIEFKYEWITLILAY